MEKITDFVKFDVGNLCMITGGRNLGRVGVVVSKEKHPGSFDIVHIKDASGQAFATRLANVFIIGKGTKSLVSLPRSKGIKKSILEQANFKKRKYLLLQLLQLVQLALKNLPTPKKPNK